MPLFTDDFTGTNGAAWDSAKWDAGNSSGTFEIQANLGQISAASAGLIVTKKVKPSSIAGQSGKYDITFDTVVTIVSSTVYYMITINGGAGDGDRYELYFRLDTGGLSVAESNGFAYSYPTVSGPQSVTCALNDVVHHRILRNPATGQFDWYTWVSGGQPGSPNLSFVDTSINTDVIEFGVLDPAGGHTVKFDNIVVSALVTGPDPSILQENGIRIKIDSTHYLSP